MTQICPILATLRHHKLTALLLILQVAVTCAIVCNVGFLIANRVEQISIRTGVDEAGLSMLNSQSVDKKENAQARHQADLLALRKIPGVSDAVAVDTMPLGRDESSYGACASAAIFEAAVVARSLDRPGCLQPAVLGGTPGELKALGLHLVEGLDFRPDEYVVDGVVPVTILSRALAEKMYPGKEALGQTVIAGERKPIRVLHAAATMLMQLDPDRIIEPDSMRTYTQMREAYFHREITMISLLIVSGLGLLFVTALGIAGLANFWVQQRTRQIGIRPAIGAIRGNILRYF